VKSGEVGNFLPALLRHIPRPLWIIGDRRPAHRSQVTRDFLSGPGERWWGEYLPGYAPELNPVESIWAYGKQHALPNVCPKDYGSLDETARPNAEKNAAPSASHHGLLAAGRTVLLMSLYYTKLNKSEVLNASLVIRQNLLPGLQRVDRCTTCHLGVEDPTMKNAPQPFSFHPNLAPHVPSKFGCTICHGGTGLGHGGTGCPREGALLAGAAASAGIHPRVLRALPQRRRCSRRAGVDRGPATVRNARLPRISQTE
jgi:hypothetical protein